MVIWDLLFLQQQQHMQQQHMWLSGVHPPIVQFIDEALVVNIIFLIKYDQLLPSGNEVLLKSLLIEYLTAYCCCSVFGGK